MIQTCIEGHSKMSRKVLYQSANITRRLLGAASGSPLAISSDSSSKRRFVKPSTDIGVLGVTIGVDGRDDNGVSVETGEARDRHGVGTPATALASSAFSSSLARPRGTNDTGNTVVSFASAYTKRGFCHQLKRHSFNSPRSVPSSTASPARCFLHSFPDEQCPPRRCLQ